MPPRVRFRRSRRPSRRGEFVDDSAWTKLTPPTSPSVRDSSLSAFDPATGQLVLYGGAGGFFPGTLAVDHDTWTFDGAAWSKHITTVTPGDQGRLSGGSMAYDPASKQLVLLGLGDGDAIGTWTWNGSQWTTQHPAQSPVPYGQLHGNRFSNG